MGWESTIESGEYVKCPKCNEMKAISQNHWGGGSILVVCVGCGLHLSGEAVSLELENISDEDHEYRKFKPVSSFIDKSIIGKTLDDFYDNDVDLRTLVWMNDDSVQKNKIDLTKLDFADDNKPTRNENVFNEEFVMETWG